MKKNNLMWDVDTQFDFMDPEGKLYVPGTDMMSNMRNIASTMGLVTSHAGYKFAGSVDKHAPDDPEFEVFPEHCVYGTPGQLKIPELKFPNPIFVPMEKLGNNHIKEIADDQNQVLFEKNTPDCRVNKNIEPYLAEVNPEKIFVYGIVTEICVDKAVRYLTELGYNVFVVEDAIKEIDPDAANQCKEDWKKMGAKFVKAYDVINSI